MRERTIRHFTTPEGHILDLKRPLDTKLSFEDGYWIVQNEELGVHGIGDRPEAAREDFAAYLGALWSEYVAVDPQGLTKDGSRLGNDLRAMVQE